MRPGNKTARGNVFAARMRAFTLMELLVTIGIVAVLTTIAAPSYRNFSLDQRISAQANELLADIHVARSRAILGAARTEMTPAEADWSSGWNVDVLDRSANPGQPDRISLFQRRNEAEDTRVVADGNSDLIAFAADGSLSTPGNGITLHVCVGTGTSIRSRSIVVLPAGMAEVRREEGDACGQGG